MPLGFHSLSHGTVPFGFFNIATDMILLRDSFVFASDFCGWMSEWAEADESVHEDRPLWVIDDPSRIGNLHTAIAGEDHSGFIGAVYERYPFPAAPEDFKQDPDGHETRPLIEQIVRKHAGPARPVPVVVDSDALTFGVGAYLFDAPGLEGLIRYLWLGGMPRWRDERRPAYVEAMMATIRTSRSPLFVNFTAGNRPIQAAGPHGAPRGPAA